MEYNTRLERLDKTGELTEIQVRAFRTHLSAANEMKQLRANTKEHELYYPFRICLFASKLIPESKEEAEAFTERAAASTGSIRAGIGVIFLLFQSSHFMLLHVFPPVFETPSGSPQPPAKSPAADKN